MGDIDAYGSQYSMRIWLDPAKLNSYQMTTKDVTDAISSQNAQIAVGQLGGTPSVDKQALNATINSQSLLQTPEQHPQYHSARQSGWFRGDAGRCRHRRNGGGEVRLS
ncbi:efflux RND transporter permease subunit [Klebsiella pneumoniae]